MNDLSRRQLLARGLFVGGGLAVGLPLPRPRAVAAAAASTTPEVLGASQWATVDAIAARLIPTDHEPGAREAGCVNFIDKALANEDAAARPVYVEGLRGVDATARAQAGAPFAELEAETQDAILRSIEDGTAPGWPAAGVGSRAFFGQIWMHTLWGFLADPKYAGNRDFAGWRVIGYPGGRHRRGGYSPAQMAGQEPVETAWGGRLPRREEPGA